MKNKTEIPYGYGHCGCGQKTNIAAYTDKSKGWVKNEPKKFILGHQRRKSPIWYIVDANGCWVWQGALTDKGYGTLTVNKRSVLAHRHYYKKFKGNIPKGAVLDHLCRNPACVNPDHLEIVSQLENVRRGKATKLTRKDVIEIHRLRASNLPFTKIAAIFDIHPAHVCRIANKIYWREI